MVLRAPLLSKYCFSLPCIPTTTGPRLSLKPEADSSCPQSILRFPIPFPLARLATARQHVTTLQPDPVPRMR